MLSVLSSGTLHLSEELGYARIEANRLRGENAQLHDKISRRRGTLMRHAMSTWQSFAVLQEHLLKRTAFMGLVQSRLNTQTEWRLKPSGGARSQDEVDTAPGSGSGAEESSASGAAPRSLGAGKASRGSTARSLAAGAEIRFLRGRLEEMRRRSQDFEEALRKERATVGELEAEVTSARTQVAELQATLKDSYMQQFEEAQRRKPLTDQIETLERGMEKLKGERERLIEKVARQQEDLAALTECHADSEMRLHEASRELSIAEEVITDITSSKCAGLQRFFEKYNLPSVVLALFRKTVELQGLCRRGGGVAVGTVSTSSIASPCASSPRGSRASVGSCCASTPRGGLHGAQTSYSSSSLLEAEVRQNVSLNGKVSRSELQAYLEGLRLANVTAGMVAQVILVLLDLDPGEGSFDVGRFIYALTSPPSWEQLDCITALWGAIGEPAMWVVQQHRRSRAGLANGAGAAADAMRRNGVRKRGRAQLVPLAGRKARRMAG
eukprot:CAMPEP_0170584032 /NCGR_PEP_ID=MMETSP0224-20130122/8472_1 /TAXON_ID=285029 /ORGANISM="Togula jolla, Strain CCCM 725" /LENGTH=495 /DNA_ID=CAMNT_0010907439 /DNA_START=30 /DNA_END=1515 /DNA_ORIENTATION=-